jgi:predicted amidohydrolase YtcJ
MVIDLMDTTSFEQIVEKVAEAVKTAKPGDWIQGRGWHQEKWTSVPAPNVEGFPYHDALSKVSPDNPVVLEHASGHASFAEGHGAGGDFRRRIPGATSHDKAGVPSAFATHRAWWTRPRRWQAAKTRIAPLTFFRRSLATEEAFSKGITSFQTRAPTSIRRPFKAGGGEGRSAFGV